MKRAYLTSVFPFLFLLFAPASGVMGDTAGHVLNDQLAAEAAALAPAFVAPAAAPPVDPAGNGLWGPVIPWTPHIPVTAATLPDGRLLTFASNQRTTFPAGPEFTYAAVWDPETGVFTEINNTRHDMFCGGTSMLPDGRLIINGGRATTELSSLFDFRTNEWTALPDMNDPRWYNSNVPLPDGSVFTVSGSGGFDTAERWTEASGWRRLPGINWGTVTTQPGYVTIWHPFLTLSPTGKLFHFGPTREMNWVDPDGLGSLTDSGLRVPGTHYPKEGAWAVYEAGKILVTGGGISPAPDPLTSVGTSATTAYTVDLNGPTPVVAPAAPMQFARQFANSVILPSGEVMVIGGNAGVAFDDAGSILTPELWNPRTGTWRTLADISIPRNYHSVALLLPDGRVWSGGGGLGGNAADHQDAQIFTPPALINPDGSLAERPTLSTAPASIGIGSTFTVTGTPGLAKFAFIRMSAVTHSINTDLRYLELSFSETTPGSYSINANSNINVMTPGYWMLFGIAPSGVYSVSRTILVDITTAVTLVNPGNRTDVTGSPVSLQLVGSGPVGATLAYAATGLPSGLSINPATGLISGLPNTPGVYNVRATVSTAISNAIRDFVWTVSTSEFNVAFDDFTGAAGLTRNGNAAIVGPALRLATNTAFSLGSAFLTNAIPVIANTSFSTRFVFRQHGRPDGGDGLAFVIQSTGVNALGEDDWGLGYAGIPNSLAVEIDTFLDDGDPDGNHLGVVLNGASTDHRAVYTPTFQLDDAASHTVWVEYDGLANVLRVYLSQTVTTTRPAQPVITLTDVDLPALVGSRAWFGFTASTGPYEATWGDQDIEAWSLNVSSASAVNPPLVTNPGDIQTVRGTTVSQQIQATDPDGDVLAYTATGLPAGLSISGDTGLITGIPTAEGTNSVTVTVTDGISEPASASFVWTIRPVATLQPLSGPIIAVGSTITLSGVSAGGVNPEFSWNFGDGTPPTPFGPSATATHTFAAPGRYLVTLTLRDATGRTVTSSFFQGVSAPLSRRKPTASSSIAYQPRSTGNAFVWVVNPDSNTVSVFDAVTRRKLAETAVASSPRTVAVAPDGRIWVVGADGAAISILSGSKVVKTIALPRGSRPFGLAFDPTGAHAWLTLEDAGRVLRLNAVTGAQTLSLNVGQNVRHLSVSADGKRVYVSRFITPRLSGEETGTIDTANQGGEVVVIDTAALAIARTIRLQHSEALDTAVSGKGIPNYLGAPVISPDGLSALVPSKQDNIKRGVLRNGLNLTHESAVRAIASRIDLVAQAEDYGARLDLDNAGMPSAVCFDPSGVYAFIAIEASRAVAVVDVRNAVEITRFPTGRAPQGLAISPDGRTLFVQNFMDRSVTVHDVSALRNGSGSAVPTVATLKSAVTEKLTPQILLGKQLFYDAMDSRLALQEYLSCATCHNDAGQDGRVWDFTGFGEGLRNTITLRGHGRHGVAHWSGNFDEVQDFENQIRNFAGGTGLIAGTPHPPLGTPNAGRSADLDALAAYLASLTRSGASPARSTSGTFSSSAIAGRRVFKAQNCGSCHGGAAFTNSALDVLRDVGTIKQPTSGQRLGGPLAGLDVPTLRGLWSTAPYLHDGSAATISDAIRAHSGVNLGNSDLANLAAYVRNIDDAIATAPLPLSLVLSTTSAEVSGRFTVTATFSGPATGFALADITVTNGTAGSLAGRGSRYTFVVTPRAVGVVNVSVRAGLALDADRDPNLASNTLSVTRLPNRPPVVTAVGAQTTVRGQSATPLQVIASDPDGQTLSYTATGLPAGLAISSTGRISGTVSAAAAASNTVTVTVSDGSLTASTSFTWDTTQSLSLAFTGRDIGTPGRAGSNSLSAGVYTVRGGGTDIAGTSDKYRFLSKTFGGDGEIIVRVTSQTNTNGWAKAGVMFRETLNANSRYAMMDLTPSNGTGFQWRATTGGISTRVSGASVAAPDNWLRISRRGDVFTGYVSPDGTTWTEVGAITIQMSAAVQIGLCVTSRNNTSLSTANFDNVQLKP